AFNGVVEDGKLLARELGKLVLNKDYAQQLLNARDTRALDKLLFTPDSDFGRIGQGAFYHALFKDPLAGGSKPNTPSLDAAWPKYISEQVANLKSAGLEKDDVEKYKL